MKVTYKLSLIVDFNSKGERNVMIHKKQGRMMMTDSALLVKKAKQVANIQSEIASLLNISFCSSISRVL